MSFLTVITVIMAMDGVNYIINDGVVMVIHVFVGALLVYV